MPEDAYAPPASAAPAQASDADGVLQPHAAPTAAPPAPPHHLLPPPASVSGGLAGDGNAPPTKRSSRAKGDPPPAGDDGTHTTEAPSPAGDDGAHTPTAAAAAATQAQAEAEAERLRTVLFGCNEEEFVRTYKSVVELSPEQSFAVARPARLRMGEEQWYQVLCHSDDLKGDEALRVGCESYTHTYSLCEGVDFVRHQDILPLTPDTPTFEHDLWGQLFLNALTAGPEKVAVCKQRPDIMMDADRRGLQSCMLWCSEALGITIHVLPIMAHASLSRRNGYALTYKV